jgi:hypothetical protein
LYLLNNAFVQDESLHLARNILQNSHLSSKERIRQAYLAILLREPTSQEVKRAAKFIKEETKLLASAAPERVTPRTSTPEMEPQPDKATPVAKQVAFTVSDAVSTNAVPTANAAPGNAGGYRGGIRAGNGRRFVGPGSASDVVVSKLAPGIARPPVFHQALPEKPATPGEGAFALFTQALFGSAEFRYLQ